MANRRWSIVPTEASDPNVVWPDDDLGGFLLPDDSWGHPGCDECEEEPAYAVVCIGGEYLCDRHMALHEGNAILDMLDRLEPNEQNRS